MIFQVTTDIEWFITHINNLNSNVTPAVVITNDQALDFMTDQIVHWKINCGNEYAGLANDTLHECALIRILLYKHKLVVGDPRMNDIHIHMYDLEKSNVNTGGSLMHTIRGAGIYAAQRTALTDWLSNPDYVKFVTEHVTNLVCTMAYVFRQKGHHFVKALDYEDAYTKLWNKVHQTKWKSSWEMLPQLPLMQSLP